MNWITNYVRPKINSMLGRREMPDNLWIKDPESGEIWKTTSSSSRPPAIT
jgi:acetyl-CoA carboxylase carboxyl transferase subunit beta